MKKKYENAGSRSMRHATGCAGTFLALSDRKNIAGKIAT